MAKVLGLDLGTNSLGWALVDESENEYTLIDKGVDIFQEGATKTMKNLPFRIGRAPGHCAATISGGVCEKSNYSKYSSVTTFARRCPRSC